MIYLSLTRLKAINWARILAQQTYYFYAYFSLLKSPKYNKASSPRIVVPSGNFGDILAGFFANRMTGGELASKLVIATNENDVSQSEAVSINNYTNNLRFSTASSAAAATTPRRLSVPSPTS